MKKIAVILFVAALFFSPGFVFAKGSPTSVAAINHRQAQLLAAKSLKRAEIANKKRERALEKQMKLTEKTAQRKQKDLLRRQKRLQREAEKMKQGKE